jgi:hypothetical protein
MAQPRALANGNSYLSSDTTTLDKGQTYQQSQRVELERNLRVRWLW